MKVSELHKAKKKQVVAIVLKMAQQNKSLKESARRSIQPTVIRHASHADDHVPSGWTERHGIEIPRAEGIFESATAWVRIKHGVIVGAGLKNQSILSMMVSTDLLDEGWVSRANQYMDWRTAFLTCVDPTKWTAEQGRGDPEAWTKEDRYSKLQHRVDQDHIAAMDCIVASRPKSRHLAAYNANQKAFVEAFKTVAKAMARIDEEAEAALAAMRKA